MALKTVLLRRADIILTIFLYLIVFINDKSSSVFVYHDPLLLYEKLAKEPDHNSFYSPRKPAGSTGIGS